MFYEAWNFESGRKARYRETRTTSLLTRPRSILLLSSEKLQPFPGKRIVSDSFECRDLEPGDEDSESTAEAQLSDFWSRTLPIRAIYFFFVGLAVARSCMAS
jgi:hypothetical protein